MVGQAQQQKGRVGGVCSAAYVYRDISVVLKMGVALRGTRASALRTWWAFTGHFT